MVWLGKKKIDLRLLTDIRPTIGITGAEDAVRHASSSKSEERRNENAHYARWMVVGKEEEVGGEAGEETKAKNVVGDKGRRKRVPRVNLIISRPNPANVTPDRDLWDLVTPTHGCQFYPTNISAMSRS